jgi:DNA-binding transcriptional regulator YiaG
LEDNITEKTYQSEILGVLHEMAEDLHEIGAINDSRMQEYDKNCLVSTPKSDRGATEPQKPEIHTPATA